MGAFRKALSRVLASRLLVAWTAGLVVIAGLLTYRALKVDLFPPLNFPILDVITEVPSFSSLEMERQVTLPLESAASGVLGVRKVRSTSATGISLVSVEFAWGTDMIAARQLLMEALSAARGQLPADADSTVENLSAALALIEGYSLRGPGDQVALRDLALYDLKPRLQRIPGVYKVLVMGGKVAEYTVRPKPHMLIKYDLTLDDVSGALADNNILSSPGVVNARAQELVIHTNGQFADAGEIGGVVVAVKSGFPVRVQDVASVEKGLAYERGDTSDAGAPAVLINILKQPNFDTGAVAASVAAEIASFRRTLPAGDEIGNYYDQAQLVDDSIASVKESVWIGAVFVVLVLALFLRHWRTTTIATLSIPLSVLTAIVLMRASGIGINIMSLGGLAIGTAIIVDDAIVVLENIFRWLSTPELRAGRGPRETIVAATAEVASPVVVSTAANIGIFLPMFFIEGFAGRLFAPVSATVTFALLASLVVALTVIPTLADRFLAGHEAPEKEGALHAVYARVLAPALKRPLAILLLTLPALAVAFAAYRTLEVEFLPDLDESAILVQTVMPPGTSLTETRRLGVKFEDWLKGMPGVIAVVRRTGHAPGAEDTDTVNHSDIMVKLLPKNDRPIPLDDFIAALKARTDGLPGIQVSYLMPLADKINDALGGVPADIGIDLFGPDLAVLHAYASKLLEKMASIKGLTDVRPPSDFPVPSLETDVDKKEAGRLGITERAIHDALRAYSDGLTATTVLQVQKEIGVVLRFNPAGANLDLEALRSLPLKTAGGSSVPLEQVARFGYGEVPSEILHENLSRKLTVTAGIEGRATKDVASDLTKALDGLSLPAGYSWAFSGKYATEQSALSNMLEVFGLSILVVAFILWIEFRSLREVALILLTIPLAAVGAVLSLWACHETLNVSSMIGAVLLVGIVVRNGIMLVDYSNMARRAGAAREEAVRTAASKRLRPILMTASVTILGLLPLATGWGTGAELQRPLAIAVIGGLVTSTLLTLLVLPAAMLRFGE
ncbi:MAG TPA: efflux RND transporter permease subunit [Elusimicrobiota bacterium]|jgi:cobalt-zinc-cadmium resistance protein CzcA|nr:efflux RND transporter permease subunit [Elusimicrobiota bacterium]